MHWVYKNRQGQDTVVVWTQYNHANLREEICFVTDYDYNLKEDILPEYYQYNQVDTEDEEGFEIEEINDDVYF